MKEGKQAQQDLPRDTPCLEQGVGSRRAFLRRGAVVLGAGAAAAVVPEQAGASSQIAQVPPAPDSTFLDLLRVPDSVICYEKFEKTRHAGAMVLKRSGEHWTRGQVIVETRAEQHALVATLAARSNAVSLVHLRWRARVPTGLAVLGDAWERSYGDLSCPIA